MPDEDVFSQIKEALPAMAAQTAEVSSFPDNGKFLADVISGKTSIINPAKAPPRVERHPCAVIQCSGFHPVRSATVDGRDLPAIRNFFGAFDGCALKLIEGLEADGHIVRDDDGVPKFTMPLERRTQE